MPILAALLLAGTPFYVELRDARWAAADEPGAARSGAGHGPESRAEDRIELRPSAGRPAVRESIAESGSHPFRDLLVSWNVDAPPRTAFVVELRVDPEGDGAWSPWMHLGDWGESELVPPLAQRTVACAGGRVDVDFFRGDRTFRAAQVRVRGLALASEPDAKSPAVAIRRLRLCFSDRELAVAPLAPLTTRPWGTVLDVAPRSQRAEPDAIAGRICSPTSLAMVLAFRGVDVPTRSVAERAFDAAHDLYGNWPRNVQTAHSFGVPGYLTRFSDWTEVERRIAEGTPIVASIAVSKGELHGAPYESTGGHLLVLVGFDAKGACVVDDPAARERDAVRRVYDRAELENVWFGRGGTAYVLEARP